MNSSPAPPSGAPLRAGRACVLVVEDELLIRLIASDLLRGEGYDVIEASNADEALAILKSGALVDLIISDVRMPGPLDGLGLLAFVRETSSTLPVIITSGHLPSETAFDDESTHFLAKPYSHSHALQLIERELEKRR